MKIKLRQISQCAQGSFKSIDQLTGNSSMPSSEMGGSPLQASDDQKRPSRLDQVVSEKQPDRGLL